MEDATPDDILSGNITDKEFTLHFISIYRDMPMLWKIKSKEYMDKNKRSIAIKKMTNLLKMCRRNITEEDVKKKINILRTSFKRENNKVKKSMLSGSGTDDVYVPSLWYYKELEFLQDQMEEESGISTITEEQESSSSQSSTSTSSQPSAPINPAQPKKKKKEDLQHDLMTLARDHFKKPENEYQAMAKNWAFKLERMSAGQRRLAEKFINEILFEGEEGNLRRHSVIINPSSEYSIPSSPSSVPCIQSPVSHTQSPIPQSPSPVSYIQSPVSHTQSPIPQSPSPVSYIQSPISHTHSPIPRTPSPFPYIQSPILHTQAPVPQTPSAISHTQFSTSSTQSTGPQASSVIPIEQAYHLSNTEQPVTIHIPDSQTNENSPTEDETAAKFLQNFYSF